MKRLSEDSICNLMRNIACSLLSLSVFLQAVVSAQDPAPPEPTPVLEIKGAKQGQRDDFLDFEAVGEPDKCTYRWLVLPRGIVKQRQEGDKLTIVGKPGKYTLLLSVSTGEVETAAEMDFEIVEGVKPPDPPPLVIPTTLKKLAGDKAAPLSQLYAEMLASIGKGAIDSVEVFKATEEIALKDRGLVGHGATAEIAKRLDVKTLEEIKAALAKIVEELGDNPVPDGKKLVVLVHETEDDDAAMGRLIVNIRDGEIAKYLKDHGHGALILDDDLASPVLDKLRPFEGLPMVYVLDKESSQVLYKQAAPMESSGFLAAIKKGGA